MIKEIEAAFGETLQHLTWMDAATRVEAEAKLKTLVNQIGYPDVWRDYSNLRIGRDSYLANALQSASFESRFALTKIGRPVDRTEWGMPASMVNAYYDAENNKMVFPAGILQPPFFAATAPAPVNYGGIGMVMGHELTHGFDDQGRKFDAKGNMRDWWTANVAKEFDKGVDCLDKQYSAYTVIDGLHVNGKLTMGENIADQGGIHLAFDAWLRKSGGQGEDQAGFTPVQQLFLGYAQSWCTTQRPERQRALITMDPHSPPRFRVNGPLANFDEFSKAFGCKAGDKMVPENRCKIW
jgi:endothelin-converting enzyme/putative endopeptidase